MGNLKTCDAHDKEFPANLIDTDKHEMVTVYIEKKVQDPKDAKKKITLTLFVGNSVDEGVDTCQKCCNDWLLSRIVPIGGKVSWKQVVWEQESYTKKDGTTGQKNVKHVIEV